MTTAPLLRSAKSKPLVLLEQGASAHILQLRQVRLPPACAGLPAAHERPEACLVAALADGHLDGAALLLSGFLRRRLNALWGWWCLHQTLDAIAHQRAQAGDDAGADDRQRGHAQGHEEHRAEAGQQPHRGRRRAA
ncbi:MAG: hypothetical protein L6R48_11120 [Planctomycetes bacterium]|nr:hypothetical protein [Planctomycetota bacterium]